MAQGDITVSPFGLGRVEVASTAAMTALTDATTPVRADGTQAWVSGSGVWYQYTNGAGSGDLAADDAAGYWDLITINAPPPALTISKDDRVFGSGYSRSSINWITAGDRTLNSTPTVGGRTGGPHYLWNISFIDLEATARQFEALALWSQKEYDAKRDGHLVLTDEEKYLASEVSPHSRTLVASLAESWTGASWVYGYGIFKVKIEWQENGRSEAGVKRGDTRKSELVTFQAVEM